MWYNLIRSFRYRIYPSNNQVALLGGQLREACDLYNCCIEERKSAWKTCRKIITYYDQSPQLKKLRNEGLVRIENAQCARDVIRRLDKAYKYFFGKIKKGEKAGLPRYKSVNNYNSITFPKYGNGCKLKKGKLYIQGAGLIKIKLHRPIEGKIKTVTIKRKAGNWYAIFCVECEPRPLQVSTEEIGIDVGLTSFATLSDGSEIKNNRFYKHGYQKIKIASRKVARRKKGSNRRRKAVLLLQKAHEHVANQRSDFLHKESRKIINSFGLIAVEDLNVKGLASGMLAKSVNDAGWGMFYRYLTYKAESAGRKIVRVNPSGTSQTCVCGAAVRKGLKDRWHECDACGLSEPRDLVSARVILQRARMEPSSANVVQ